MSRTNETLVRNEVLIPIPNQFVFVFVFVFVLAHEQAIRKRKMIELAHNLDSKPREFGRRSNLIASS